MISPRINQGAILLFEVTHDYPTGNIIQKSGLTWRGSVLRGQLVCRIFSTSVFDSILLILGFVSMNNIDSPWTGDLSCQVSKIQSFVCQFDVCSVWQGIQAWEDIFCIHSFLQLKQRSPPQIYCILEKLCQFKSLRGNTIRLQ